MTMQLFRAKLFRYWPIVLIPVLGIVFLLIAVKTVNPVEYPNNDFFTFWLAGHLATTGQDPYLTGIWLGGHQQFGSTLIHNITFIYPMPLALLFAPLGLIPLYQAFVLWVFFTQCMIVSAIALLLGSYPGPLVKRFILPVLAGVILFRPTIITLTNGQLSGFLLLVIACMLYLWEKGKWWQGALLLPVLAIKPNLGIPIIGLLSIYLIQQKKGTSFAAEGISGLALLMAGWILDPKWISEFLSAGSAKLERTFGFSPTVWGTSTWMCGYRLDCALGLGIALALLVLAVFMILLWKRQRPLSPALAVSLAIPVMLLVTPYTWPYDQLLLILPLITVPLSLAKAGYRYLPTALIFLGLDVLAMVLLAISAVTQKEVWNVALPVCVLGLLAWHIHERNS